MAAIRSWCQTHTYVVEVMAFGTAFKLSARYCSL
jgi:hypothetical protein